MPDLETLQEAHEPSDFHAKVKSLHKGETARLKGGVAVKRMATEDGRDVFKVGSPSNYRGGADDYYGDNHRTAEDATREAFRKSARSTDPESIGGTTALPSYGTYVGDTGSPVRIRDWTTDGRAVVGSGPHDEKIVHPSTLTKQSPVMYEGLREAADSMAKASTPEPFSKSKTSNWVARGGGLPPYIQHIAHDLMEKRGKTESEAIGMAIGIVKRWARGGGNVDSGTKAAAQKALGEWEKLKAGAHAKSALKEAAEELENEGWSKDEVNAGIVATYGAAVPPFPVREGEAFWLPPLQEHVRGWSPASRDAALAKKKALHPDWNWAQGISGARLDKFSDGSAMIHLANHPDLKHLTINPGRKSGHIAIEGKHKTSAGPGVNLGEHPPEAARKIVERLAGGGGATADVKDHYKTLGKIRHTESKIPEGIAVKKAKTVPDTYDLKRAESVHTVHAADGTHLGHVAKVNYGGQAVQSSAGGFNHTVGHTGAGKKWAAFDEHGRQIKQSVHFNRNRADALRQLGRYHPKHGSG